MYKNTAQLAHEHGMQGCPICTSVGPIGTNCCGVCGVTLHPHWDKSIQRTWAWLLTSIMLYVPANFLPILHTRILGRVTENTIMGGVITLWDHGSYPIATVIFVASIVVPLAKIIVLGWLCLSVQWGSTFAIYEKTELYRVTEFVGRWSMVDVFVVAILVALIQLGAVMAIVPGIATLAFSAMVITSMMAAIAFDPRLLWTVKNKERA